MTFKLLKTALVSAPFLIAACNSSSTDGGEDGAPNLVFDDAYDGVPNGTFVLGGKSFPMEYGANAYAKRLFIGGYTDLAHRDTGWQISMSASAATNADQGIEDGANHVDLWYRPLPDSTQCIYRSKVGTVTIQSFVSKLDGTRRFFRSTGKASFTAAQGTAIAGSQCPDITVELNFKQVDATDGGSND
jgi:hypothetical protein